MATLYHRINTMIHTRRSIPRWFEKQEAFNMLPDIIALKIKYKNHLYKSLNLKNPQTYTEKLQWIKLYDHRPEYTMMVDKYSVKRWVSEVIGEEYVIPTLGVWNSFEEIDFEQLPDKFVLKCTHSSGDIVICKNKAYFDKKSAGDKLNHYLNKDFYIISREWPYKDVQRRIIAEPYIEDDKTKELRDYKFFTFNGIVRAVFVASDRQKINLETKFDFFDADFNHLDIVNGHPNSEVLPEKPKCFDEMKKLASLLGKNIPQVRIDFYEVNGRVYFGEMTFFHHSGLTAFEPEIWDKVFGSWIILPQKRR